MFHNLFVWLSALVTQNQIFSGVIGAGLVGTVAYALKSVPLGIYESIKWLVTIRVTISNDLSSYEAMLVWLGARMQKWYVRDLKLSQDDPDDDDAPVSHSLVLPAYNLGPGYGAQWLMFGGWPYHVDRAAKNEEHASAKRIRETVTITTLGVSRARMNALLKAAFDGMVEKEGISIFFYNSWWTTIDKRMPRALDSVVLRTGETEALVDDINRFIGNKETYVRRGVPYRRGYLFSGPPGTGKSSLAIAIAGHYRMPMYVLNIGSLDDDEALFSAVSGVPSNGILLIEDIDAADIGKVRIHEETTENGPGGATKSKEEKGAVTLSGLLNCLDGVIAKEGRILIMTSNHPERLDPALIRPGRVDKRIEFALASAEEASRLFLRFFEDEPMAQYILKNYGEPKSAAEIQGICQDFADDDPAVCAGAICGEDPSAMREIIELCGGRFKDAAE